MRSEIPSQITAEIVREALIHIDKNGIPPKRKSTKYDLVFNNRRYPPKYVISIATKLVTGKPLLPDHFFGGPETNSYLTKLHFDIRDKENRRPPIQQRGHEREAEGSLAYWWVNHNQTFQEETNGGYLWSPKERKDGGNNQFYNNMTVAKPGDIVFSYARQMISSIGIVQEKAFTARKPSELSGSAVTDNWNIEGWLLPTSFQPVSVPIRPKEHWAQIKPLLPGQYSPLSLKTGEGNQGAYLASISEDLGLLLLRLTGSESFRKDVDYIEDQIEVQIKQSKDIPETEKDQLIKSRRGQGLYRERLESIEKKDRVTGLDIKSHLRASHIKPWRDSSNEERLDGNNGLLLSPHVDHLFDQGYISFSDEGDILISPLLNSIIFSLWHINLKTNVGKFNIQQSKYLAYHQKNVFKRN